jgi:hypothetical protein
MKAYISFQLSSVEHKHKTSRFDRDLFVLIVIKRLAVLFSLFFVLISEFFIELVGALFELNKFGDEEDNVDDRVYKPFIFFNSFHSISTFFK